MVSEVYKSLSNNDIIRLAEIIRSRNDTEKRIAEIIGRRGDKGPVGEYIASRIFSIELAKSGRQKAYDGFFIKKPLEGKSVDVKFYPKQQWSIDINPKEWPDYFLVLTGPQKVESKAHPWVIESVYLFESKKLKKLLSERGVKIGRPTSVVQEIWRNAEVYPKETNPILSLSKTQRKLLSHFN